jgi:hypothetical protein
MLMPSTPFAYPHVVSRTFASFRVLNFYVSAGQGNFCTGFDSRQLHQVEKQVGDVFPGLFCFPSTGRVGQNVLHCLETVKPLSDRGVSLVSLTDGIDFFTAAGPMMIGGLGSLAECEREPTCGLLCLHHQR